MIFMSRKIKILLDWNSLKYDTDISNTNQPHHVAQVFVLIVSESMMLGS